MMAGQGFFVTNSASVSPAPAGAIVAALVYPNADHVIRVSSIEVTVASLEDANVNANAVVMVGYASDYGAGGTVITYTPKNPSRPGMLPINVVKSHTTNPTIGGIIAQPTLSLGGGRFILREFASKDYLRVVNASPLMVTVQSAYPFAYAVNIEGVE